MILALMALNFQTPVMKPLTITSYNIRYGTANDGEDRWELRKPRTFALLKKRPSDILAIQEALDFQVDELKGELGFSSVGVGRDDGIRAGEFSAILFNAKRFRAHSSGTFWLSDTPEKVGSKSWGNNVIRICTWACFEDLPSTRRFHVFNTHFDHQSQPSREKSAGLIVQRMKSAVPQGAMVLTGDFNAGESNAAIAAIKAAGFRDTWRVMHEASEELGTFNGFKELGKEKIDYVFVNDFWRVRTARIIDERIDGRWLSDHLPVTATIEWPLKK